MVLLHSSHVRMVGVQNVLTLQATVKRCFLFSFSFSLLSFPQQSSCWLRTLVMHRHKAFMKSYPPANKNLSVLFLLIWHSNNWKSKVTYTKTNDKKNGTESFTLTDSCGPIKLNFHFWRFDCNNTKIQLNCIFHNFFFSSFKCIHINTFEHDQRLFFSVFLSFCSSFWLVHVLFIFV